MAVGADGRRVVVYTDYADINALQGVGIEQVAATFRLKKQRLPVTATGTAGFVTSSPAGIDCGGPATPRAASITTTAPRSS